MSKLAQWTGHVTKIEGSKDTDKVQVLVQGEDGCGFYYCKLDDLPNYGEPITVTFSRGAPTE